MNMLMDCGCSKPTNQLLLSQEPARKNITIQLKRFSSKYKTCRDLKMPSEQQLLSRAVCKVHFYLKFQKPGQKI